MDNVVPNGKAREAKQRGEWVNMDLKEKVKKNRVRNSFGIKVKAKGHAKSKNYPLPKDKRLKKEKREGVAKNRV